MRGCSKHNAKQYAHRLPATLPGRSVREVRQNASLAGVRSSHLLERIANAPPIPRLVSITASLTFDRLLGCDQRGLVTVLPQELASVIMDLEESHRILLFWQVPLLNLSELG